MLRKHKISTIYYWGEEQDMFKLGGFNFFLIRELILEGGGKGLLYNITKIEKSGY